MPQSKENRDVLSKLPEEVVEIITTHCDEHVIKLRSTCRDLQRKTDHVFSKRCFRIRHIWIDSNSLETLQAISTEDRFAKCVRAIHVHAYEWNDTAPKRSARKKKDECNDILKRSKAQKALLNSGQAIQLLTLSMSKFTNLKDIACPEFSEPEDLWPNSHFKEVVHNGLNDEHELDDPEHRQFSTDIWLMLIQAISQCQPELSSFDFSVVLPIEGILAVTTTRAQILSTAFAKLDSLTLNVATPELGLKHNQWQKFLARLLRLCPDLTTLNIDFGNEGDVQFKRLEENFDQDAIACLDNWPTYPKLKALNLRSMTVKGKTLAAFIKRHVATLDNMLLESAWLGEEFDTWKPVIEALVGAPLLNSVIVSIWAEDQEEHDIMDVLHDTPEEMQNRIKDALENGPEELSDGEDRWDDEDENEVDYDGFGDGDDSDGDG